MYGALDVRLFPNKRLNVDLKNIEIWRSVVVNPNAPKLEFFFYFFTKNMAFRNELLFFVFFYLIQPDQVYSNDRCLKK